MLYREIEEKIKDFFQTEKKSALMITGARQVGKTYCIRESVSYTHLTLPTNSLV